MSFQGFGFSLNYHFTNYTSADGLSENTIRAIVQDRRGFIWVGTNSGLNRFDGYQFTTFKSGEGGSNTLSSDHIFALFEDRDGIIWIGTFNGLNRLDPETMKFTHYRHDPMNEDSLSSNKVSRITQDSKGYLWISTYGGGLNRFDPKSEHVVRFVHDDNDPDSLNGDRIRVLALDKNRQILWIGTKENGIGKLDLTTQHFQKLEIVNLPKGEPLTTGEVNVLHVDSQGVLWAATTDKGLLCIETMSDGREHLCRSPFPETAEVFSLFEDLDGNLWIDSADGLKVYRRASGAYVSVRALGRGFYGINRINLIYQDRDKQLWFGSHAQGLFKLNQQSTAFAHYRYFGVDKATQSKNTVNDIIETANGEIWIGTENGLHILSQKLVFQRQIWGRDTVGENAVSVKSLYQDSRGNIWIGTREKGLFCYFVDSGEFKNMVQVAGFDPVLSDSFVLSILEDSQGYMWFGTFSDGLFRYHPVTNQFTQFTPESESLFRINHYRVSSLLEDRSGFLWVGFHDGGVNRINPRRTIIESFRHKQDDKYSLNNDIVLSLYQDQSGRVWIGTMGGGLNLYDKNHHHFIHYKEQDGLPNNVVAGIQDDAKGDLWLSTYNGLARFNPVNETFHHYSVDDGVQNEQFSFWDADMKGKDGALYFGGINGFNRFYPEQIPTSETPPEVVLTDFLLANKPVNFQDDSSPDIAIKSYPIYAQKAVTLTAEHRLFSIEFSALHFSDPLRNQYSYKLDGWDDEWISTDSSRRIATYTNIPAGSYNFKVKASNRDGVWSEADNKLQILVLPPWYLSSVAYGIYAATFVLCIWFFIHWRTYKTVKLNEVLREKVRVRTATIEELLQQKNTLFANVSHEFRTPLTLILGPLKTVLDTERDGKTRKNVEIARDNAERMLVMVDQLLDMARFEYVKETDLTLVSVSDTASFMYFSFESAFKGKNIEFSLQCSGDFLIHCSEDALEKIVSNLLSNALKYTPEGGHVELSVGEHDEKHVVISVRDTGVGISLEDQSRVFERFTRIRNPMQVFSPGAGIGLALVRQLVEKLGGRISIVSELGRGSQFSVIFPMERELLPDICVPVQLKSDRKSNDVKEDDTTSNMPMFVEEENIITGATILIIDDNPQMCSYIKDSLDEHYQVLTANSVDEGVEVAQTDIPNIIISDVMMPGKDGFELTKLIKDDSRTNHIPVILLSALNDRKSRLSGLKAKADDYLSKPFDGEELNLKIRNHLDLIAVQQQKHLNELSQALVDASTESASLKKQESGFMHSFKLLVEEHYQNVELNVEWLANEMHFTPRTLLRKVKAMTGITVNEYIRRYRLSKAEQLLLKGMTVTQAALDVGFQSQNYFSRSFKSHYGISPTEYIESRLE
ncbi:two-component regulator propeller domain-containing protein [Paraneptunicella aestuarii]|uniref:two-component regulator propeller domain-containing protein n=1 Tax=Paraneptunicella aestuarii TaxID=2831148 RepID=UPI001E369ADD|nr:two-component regulator propeller domain-containing protein [Paraneptunicella aestuarii]